MRAARPGPRRPAGRQPARGRRRLQRAAPHRRRARLSRAEAGGATAHGNEPVDAAVVCTDNPAAIAGAADALAPGGRLCLYAPGEAGEPLPVAPWTIFSRELLVTASWSAGPREWREALALLQRGAVRTGELITHRFSLEETGDALEAQRSGAALKAVVEP